MPSANPGHPAHSTKRESHESPLGGHGIGGLTCPPICHQSLGLGQPLSNCAPQSLQVPSVLLHSSQSLTCADFHIKSPLKQDLIAFKMFEI